MFKPLLHIGFFVASEITGIERTIRYTTKVSKFLKLSKFTRFQDQQVSVDFTFWHFDLSDLLSFNTSTIMMGLWKACSTCPRLRLPCRQNVWHMVWNGGHLCLPIKKINSKYYFSFFPLFILHIRKGDLKIEVNGNIKVSWWKHSPPTPSSSYHPFFIRAINLLNLRQSFGNKDWTYEMESIA